VSGRFFNRPLSFFVDAAGQPLCRPPSLDSLAEGMKKWDVGMFGSFWTDLFLTGNCNRFAFILAKTVPKGFRKQPVDIIGYFQDKTTKGKRFLLPSVTGTL
jgi:hypothetical protein